MRYAYEVPSRKVITERIKVDEHSFCGWSAVTRVTARVLIRQTNLAIARKSLQLNSNGSNSLLSEIIKTFTKYPYSFSCFSRCHFGTKHFYRLVSCCKPNNNLIALNWATGMALALIYTLPDCVELRCMNKSSRYNCSFS